MEFDLPDNNATESLGWGLALALPDAAIPGAAPAAALAQEDPAAPANSALPLGNRALAQANTAAVRGAVLYLQGELGAGKTTCVRSLLRALGVTGLVRSPTYTLVETYTLAGLSCVHVDLYRLRVLSEVDELGLRDMVGPGTLLMVEWPEKGAGALPSADIAVTLSYAAEARRATLQAQTPFGWQWLQNLGDDTSLKVYVSNLT